MIRNLLLDMSKVANHIFIMSLVHDSHLNVLYEYQLLAGFGNSCCGREKFVN
jgi:hypothetical protein